MTTYCPHCGQHSYDPHAAACCKCGYVGEQDESRTEPAGDENL